MRVGYLAISSVFVSFFLLGFPSRPRLNNAVLTSTVLLASLEEVTFVPVPPSKHRTDPLYDNRLVRVLEEFKTLNNNVDYRDFIIQSETTESSHNAANRLSSEKLSALYSLVSNIREHVFIFDDMLTTGSYFKAVQKLLLGSYPSHSIRVYGLFIARRAVEAIDWDSDATGSGR